MNRLERLYAISERLRRSDGRPVSAARLADELEVSRRTIERDLDALRRAGLPIYAEHGRRGGQRTLERPGRDRSVVLTLGTSEVVALLVALASAGRDMPFADAGASASARLLDGLPTGTRLEVEALRARIRTAEQQRPAAPARIRRTVEEAVRRSVVLNIDYVDQHGAETSRPVEPVGLYFGGDGWYVVAWCRLRGDGRIFRFDRIRAARLTKQPCPSRDVDATLGWVPHPVNAP